MCVCFADACGGHRITCVFPQGLSTIVLGKALSLKPTLASLVNSADLPISAFSVLGLQMGSAMPGHVCVCAYVQIHVPLSVHRCQRTMSNILLAFSSPHSFETVCLTEPSSKLVVSTY